MGTVQYLGRGHHLTPDPVTAKMALLSWEKSIPKGKQKNIATIKNKNYIQRYFGETERVFK